ncbi:RNA polymerase III subunit RPC82 helix-turn-helix domain-containing protein [Zopfochytrium polystomum]|nr:RNA polymerase III subunit RPC82 helix-turn-helix domain-containing protein [Zopfochytrium polystomum]
MSGKLQGLACMIIREHFGEIVERVCSVLIRKGRSLFAAIVGATKLPPKQVRECLFVLIQHNVVQFTETVEGQRVLVYYTANLDGIVARDRIPLFAYLARVRFGETGRRMFLHLATNGRSDAKRLLKVVDTPEAEFTWKTMISQSFVERVLTEEEIAAKNAVSEVPEPKTAAKGKRGAKSGEPDQSVSAGQKRKIAISFDESESAKVPRTAQSSQNGDSADEDGVWRLNFSQFTVLARNKSRINANAAEVIKAILILGEHTSMCKFETTSQPASLPAISSRVDEDKLSETVTTPWLENVLAILEENELRFISKTDDRGGGMYVLNTQKACDHVRRDIIETYVREKFGNIGCRVWRLLFLQGMLGEKDVAKLAMVAYPTARQTLYSLTQSRLAFLQDVPKTLDHAPSRTFYLFFVSLQKCVDTLVDESYEVLMRLKLRREKQRQLVAPILEKLQRSDVQENLDILPEGEKQILDGYREVSRRLQISELRITEMLMALRDF